MVAYLDKLEIMLYEFNTCVISVCNRTCNQLAHYLAAYGACMEGVEACMYTDHAPDFVYLIWFLATCLEPMFNGSFLLKKLQK